MVVIGNAGLDLGLGVPRLPLPGETLIGTGHPRAPGGKGLNQAVVAARCGAAVRFCAPLGDNDAEAAEVEGYLAREGFAELILPRLPHATDFSLLMVLPDGENSIVSTSACSLALRPEDAVPALRDLGAGDVVLLQGNLSLATTGTLLAEARRQGATTIFTPAPFWPGAERLLGHCSLLIVNRVEAGQRRRHDRVRRRFLRHHRSRPRPRPSTRIRHRRGPESRRRDGNTARRVQCLADARGVAGNTLNYISTSARSWNQL